MDWIERIFGVSPDGGSGMLELLLFAIPIVCLYMFYKVRSKRSERKI
jgi:hypothetical protein